MKKLKECEEKYKLLEQKYKALEKQLKEETIRNQQKDHMLLQQSKLAAMGEMVATIGHQWRQPLNHLSLLIQDVSEALEFGEITEKYIDRFTSESMVQLRHMSRTIDDFQKFYRPNKVKQSFSIAESIEDALTIFSSSIMCNDIHIEFVYRGHQMAYGYQNEFSQVVLNMITNAKDAFVDRKIKNRKIEIEIEQTESYQVVIFSDNAGGIQSSIFPMIFDPYFTTKPNGTGIGLYMTKKILEKMNGMIKVENTVEGARFLIFIPKGAQENRKPSVSV